MTFEKSNEYEEFYYSAGDGLRLYARDYGRENGSIKPAIICLAGLTRNSQDFHKFALLASTDKKDPRRVVCFDYRGRGRSQYDKSGETYTIFNETDDILQGCAALGIQHGVFIGTSRGALIIHLIGAIRPGILRGVILNDAGPVIEGAGLAQIKNYLDLMSKPQSMIEATIYLKKTFGQAFSALSDDDWRDFAENIYIEKNGKLVENFDTELVNMLASIDFSTPLPTFWPQFEGLKHLPLMCIRGSNSTLLSEKTTDEMKERVPSLINVVAEGQAHAPILHIEPLAQTILSFIAGIE